MKKVLSVDRLKWYQRFIHQQLSRSCFEEFNPYALNYIIFPALVIHFTQLLSLTTSGFFQDNHNQNDTILKNFTQVINVCNPLFWASFSDKNVTIFTMWTFMAVKILLEVMGFIFYQKSQWRALRHFSFSLAEIFNIVFEYFLLIPIFSVAVFHSGGTEGDAFAQAASFLPKYNSINKNAFQATAVLLTLNILSLIRIKLFRYPKKTLFKDLIFTHQRWFDYFRLGSIAMIILFLKLAEDGKINRWVLYLICAIIGVLGGLACLIRKIYLHSPTQKFFGCFYTVFTAHSIILSIYHGLRLKESLTATIYLLSMSVAIKLFLNISTLLRDSSFSPLTQTTASQDLLMLRELMKIGKSITDKDRLILSTKIIAHLQTCSNQYCFCHTIDYHQIKDSNKKGLDLFNESTLELALEGIFEVLLKKANVSTEKFEELLFELVCYKAFEMNRYIQASLVLSKAKSRVKSTVMKGVFGILIEEIEKACVNQLSDPARERYEHKFTDALLFEEQRDLVMKDFANVRELYDEFYAHLAEKDFVHVSDLYQRGQKYVKALKNAEDKFKNLTNLNLQSPETLKMELHFRKEILKESEKEIYLLKKKLNDMVISIRNISHSNQKEGIVYNDRRNLFAIIDITHDPGAIVKASEKLLEILQIENTSFTLFKRHVTDFFPSIFAQTCNGILNSWLVTSDSLMPSKQLVDPVFLMNKNGFVVPFKVEYRLEISNSDIFGGLIMQRIESKSEYVIANSSGIFVSCTEGFQKMFEMNDLDVIKGLWCGLLFSGTTDYFLLNDAVSEEELFFERGESPILRVNAVPGILYQLREDISSKSRALHQDIRALEKDSSLLEKKKRFQRIGNLLDETILTCGNIQKFESFDVALKILKKEFGGLKFKVIQILKVTRTSQQTLGKASSNASRQFSVDSHFKLRSPRNLEDKQSQKPRSGFIMDFWRGNRGNGRDQEITPREHDNFKDTARYSFGETPETGRKLLTGGVSHARITEGEEGLSLQTLSGEDKQSQENEEKASSRIGSVRSSVRSLVRELHSIVQNKKKTNLVSVYNWIGIAGSLTVMAMLTLQLIVNQLSVQTLTQLAIIKTFPLTLQYDISVGSRYIFKQALLIMDVLNIPTKNVFASVRRASDDITIDLKTLLSTSESGVLYEDYITKNNATLNIEFIDGNTELVTIWTASSYFMHYYKQFCDDVEFQRPSTSPTTIMNHPTGIFTMTNFENLSLLLFQLNDRIREEINYQTLHTDRVGIASLSVGIVIVAIVVIGFVRVYLTIEKRRSKMMALFSKIPRGKFDDEVKSSKNKKYSAEHKNNNAPSKMKENKKMFLTLKAEEENLLIKIFFILFITGLLILPMVLSQIIAASRINAWKTAVDQINLLEHTRGRLAYLFQATYSYYTHAFDNDTYLQSLVEAKMSQNFAQFDEAFSDFKVFLLQFGKLPNQNLFDEASREQISSGKDGDFCLYRTDETYIPFIDDPTCQAILNGISKQGIIPTIEYLRIHIEEHYSTLSRVNGTGDKQRVMYEIGASTELKNYDLMINAIGGYVVVTTHKMGANIINYSKNTRSLMLLLYAIFLTGLLIVMLLGWIAFMRIMNNRLIETKKIFIILPDRIITSTPQISNYFIKEF